MNIKKLKTLSKITLSLALILPVSGAIAGDKKDESERHKPIEQVLDNTFVKQSNARVATVESFSNRLEMLEEKLDVFESDVKDGPNSKLDDALKEKVDVLSNQKEKVEEKIDNLATSSNIYEWNTRKNIAESALNSLTSDITSLTTNYHQVR